MTGRRSDSSCLSRLFFFFHSLPRKSWNGGETPLRWRGTQFELCCAIVEDLTDGSGIKQIRTHGSHEFTIMNSVCVCACVCVCVCVHVGVCGCVCLVSKEPVPWLLFQVKHVFPF